MASLTSTMTLLHSTRASFPGVGKSRKEALRSSPRLPHPCVRGTPTGTAGCVIASRLITTKCITEQLPSQPARDAVISELNGMRNLAASQTRVPGSVFLNVACNLTPYGPNLLHSRTRRFNTLVCQSKDNEQESDLHLDKQSGYVASEQVLDIKHVGAAKSASNDALINWIGALFFISGFMGCAWGRFSAIYYVGVQHFSPSQIGIIEGTLPILRCLAQPFWGAVSDKLRRRKPVALFTSLTGTALLLLLAFPDTVATSFHRVWAINLAQASFSNGGILDAFALDALGPSRALEYGKLRMFMAISWGLGSISLAHLSSRFGFHINFLAHGLLALLYNALLAIHIPAQMSSERDPSASNKQSKPPQLSALIPAFCTPSAFFFFLEVILMSAAVATVEGLLFVFLQEPRYGINASTSLCGTAVLVSILLEVPFFYYVKPIVERIGMEAMWMIGSSAMAVRCFLLAHITAANVGTLVMVAEALHGIVFTALWAAGIERARVLAPEEFRTTGLSLFQSAYTGVGIALGTFVGGYLMQHRGPKFLYLAMATLCSAIFAIRAARAVWVALTAKEQDTYSARAKAA